MRHSGKGTGFRFDTPDGTGLVIEITNDHSIFQDLSPEPPEEGIFYLRTDGRGRPTSVAGRTPSH